MTGRVLVQPPYPSQGGTYPPTTYPGSYSVPAAMAQNPYPSAVPTQAPAQPAIPNLAAAPRPTSGLIVRGQVPEDPISEPAARPIERRSRTLEYGEVPSETHEAPMRPVSLGGGGAGPPTPPPARGRLVWFVRLRLFPLVVGWFVAALAAAGPLLLLRRFWAFGLSITLVGVHRNRVL